MLVITALATVARVVQGYPVGSIVLGLFLNALIFAGPGALLMLWGRKAYEWDD